MPIIGFEFNFSFSDGRSICCYFTETKLTEKLCKKLKNPHEVHSVFPRDCQGRPCEIITQIIHTFESAYTSSADA